MQEGRTEGESTVCPASLRFASEVGNDQVRFAWFAKELRGSGLCLWEPMVSWIPEPPDGPVEILCTFTDRAALHLWQEHAPLRAALALREGRPLSDVVSARAVAVPEMYPEPVCGCPDPGTLLVSARMHEDPARCVVCAGCLAPVALYRVKPPMRLLQWSRQAGFLFDLWAASWTFEEMAKQELVSPRSGHNRWGRRVARQLSKAAGREVYYCAWPGDPDEFQRVEQCQACSGPLEELNIGGARGAREVEVDSCPACRIHHGFF